MITAELARRLRASTVKVCEGGSGVIWSADGVIATNAHVLRPGELSVVLSDGREFAASLVRQDRRRDLALLQISARDLTPAPVGDSDALRAGEIVIAAGNPFGIAGVVTAGVIYATGKRWIEASVRLAPGNSGGPLADVQGRVIGINSMLHGGLALAIPSRAVARFVRDAVGGGAKAA